MAPIGLRFALLLLLLTVGLPLRPVGALPAQRAPAVQGVPADSIRWEGLEEALTASRADGRPVLVYFTFDT
jgi:hypothetical protein